MSAKIIIIGGGIGGTAAALALLRASFDVRVYEQVAAKTEVGAGIQLSPNATRLLQRYGLGEALKLRGVRPDAVTMSCPICSASAAIGVVSAWMNLAPKPVTSFSRLLAAGVRE